MVPTGGMLHRRKGYGRPYITSRPSHLKISGGPRLARAALSRRAIDGPNVSKFT